MSILDSITAAEQEAAQIKRDALASSREIVLSADEEAKREAEKAAATARDNAAEILAKARAEADSAAKAMLNESSAKDEATAAAARGKVSSASRHIVERIVMR